MARDFIKINRTDTNATAAELLQRYVARLRESYELGVKVKAIMDHNNDGSVWSDIETLFGLPPGKGQTVYDMVNSSVLSMTGEAKVSDAKNLTETLG